MDKVFSIDEVRKVFEYAMEYHYNEAVELAIKLARLTDLDIYPLLFEAVEKCVLHTTASEGLTRFATYVPLDLIIKLLESKSEKVNSIAVLTLQYLSDPTTLQVLEKVKHTSASRIVRERAANAYKTIIDHSDDTAHNRSHVYIQAGTVDKVDVALTNFILKREHDFAHEDVGVLVKLLFLPIFSIREKAEKALVGLGAPALDLIFSSVLLINPPVTLQLLNVLREYHDPRWAHLIIQWLKNTGQLKNSNYGENNIVKKAIDALGRLGGNEAAYYLAEGIVKGEYVYHSCDVLRRMKEIPVSYLLSEYNNNDYFRRNGSQTLAVLLNTKALRSLLDGLQDRYRQVRDNAEEGLILLGAVCIESLTTLSNSSNDPELLIAICKIMGKIGDRRALETLPKLVTSKDKTIHWAAIKAIGQIRDMRSVNILSGWLESPDPITRMLVVTGLGNQKNIEAAMLLVAKAYDIDKKIRSELIVLLYDLAYKFHDVRLATTEVFLRMLNDEDQSIRLAVIEMLYRSALNFLDVQDKITNVFLLLLKEKDQTVLLKIMSTLHNLAIKFGQVRNSVADGFLHLLESFDRKVVSLSEEYLIELGSLHHEINEKISTSLNKEDTYARLHYITQAIELRIARNRRYESESRLRAPTGMACLSMGESEMTIPQIEIPKPITDTIQLAVCAPRMVSAGRAFILDVWAFLENVRNKIYKQAQVTQRNEAIMLRTKGPIKIDRDTTLSIHVNIPEFGCKQKDTIIWIGYTGNCTVPVKVPTKIESGYYLGTAKFYVGPLFIAKLNFDIEVGVQTDQQVDITTRQQLIKTAFASYASDDRNKVLARIQGMLKFVPTLDIFLDVASIRSGEDWKERLEKEIKIRELFYLFWSRSASESPWVEREWRIALMAKGIDCIDPVPLESPNNAPPPPELSSLHFDEWTLAFER